MKPILATIVFFLFFHSSYSQSIETGSSSFGVEKQFQKHKKIFIFKPNSQLIIKAENGIKYNSYKYSLSDNFIVMDMKDTILFNNISWIKGRVYGDKGRKIAGVLLFCAADLGILVVAALILSGGPVLPAYLFVSGTIYGVSSLIGARKFWRNHHCYVVRIDNSVSG
ncbi:MAG: hypothetical protein NT094_01505 [Candidatus Staskawiczbacteria bacterium]|nr:hypothetical protein [Candidatus Staskawiczbacteria bacterium]